MKSEENGKSDIRGFSLTEFCSSREAGCPGRLVCLSTEDFIKSGTHLLDSLYEVNKVFGRSYASAEMNHEGMA